MKKEKVKQIIFFIFFIVAIYFFLQQLKILLFVDIPNLSLGSELFPEVNPKFLLAFRIFILLILGRIVYSFMPKKLNQL
ncbi:hypothetical protein HN832_03425 [archaeon]|jgi:hypothetical protein|nr:hypothetical protein [archaeon]MBT4373553.1 hypothetical protein [archaeon]MBT4532001.1 hypothetical protein [archaeon]MBT7001668.1 hypothetical protein [archaeon]MBT7282440.1 hypothetical protein [archaeon]